METEEQPSSENGVKDNAEPEGEKPQEEEADAAPAVKHLEENKLFSEYYLVRIYYVTY